VLLLIFFAFYQGLLTATLAVHLKKVFDSRLIQYLTHGKKKDGGCLFTHNALRT
jgi:hypothetical protein